MGILIDLTGKKFGRLEVIERSHVNQSEKIVYSCICDCGKILMVVSASLSGGGTKSCGCLKTDGKHRKTKTKEYRAWAGMLSRCRDVNVKAYKWYGARGITVCEKWHDFTKFFEDMGLRPSEKHSIDRIDTNGNYEPSNCRWATRLVQDRNRTSNRILTYNGLSLTMIEWCERLGVKSQTMRCYLKRHSFEETYSHYAK